MLAYDSFRGTNANRRPRLHPDCHQTASPPRRTANDSLEEDGFSLRRRDASHPGVPYACRGLQQMHDAFTLGLPIADGSVDDRVVTTCRPNDIGAYPVDGVGGVAETPPPDPAE